MVGARSPNQGARMCVPPLKARGEGLSVSLPASGGCRHSAACECNPGLCLHMTFSSACLSFPLLSLPFKKGFYVFIFRRRKGERKRRRETLPLACPQLGTWPAAQASAPTGFMCRCPDFVEFSSLRMWVPSPAGVHMGSNQWVIVSHIDVSLSLSQQQ